jgi:hypothetical protein
MCTGMDDGALAECATDFQAHSAFQTEVYGGSRLTCKAHESFAAVMLHFASLDLNNRKRVQIASSAKKPGGQMKVVPVHANFCYRSAFDGNIPVLLIRPCSSMQCAAMPRCSRAATRSRRNGALSRPRQPKNCSPRTNGQRVARMALHCSAAPPRCIAVSFGGIDGNLIWRQLPRRTPSA